MRTQYNEKKTLLSAWRLVMPASAAKMQQKNSY